MIAESKPLSATAYRAATASNQPQRRGRPVTVPNSPPWRRRRSPRLVVQLRGKRTGADARAVRLHHADDPTDRGRADAEARARAAGDRVRAGDVRIRSVADVEQRSLRAFDQHALARLEALRADNRRRRRRAGAAVARRRASRPRDPLRSAASRLTSAPARFVRLMRIFSASASRRARSPKRMPVRATLST